MNIQKTEQQISQIEAILRNAMLPQGEAEKKRSELRSLQTKLGLERSKMEETRPVFLQALKDRIQYHIATGSPKSSSNFKRELKRQDPEGFQQFMYELAYDGLFGALEYRLRDTKTLQEVTELGSDEIDLLKHFRGYETSGTYEQNRRMTIDAVRGLKLPEPTLDKWAYEYQERWMNLTAWN